MKPWLLLPALVLVGVALAPVLTAEFVSLDDERLVLQNPVIRELSPRAFRLWLTTYCQDLYHPLVLASWAVEYRLVGPAPRFFHLTNLVLHLVGFVLVYHLARALTGDGFAGLVTALLFGLHPLNVEPVAWIAARKYPLAAPFFLGTLLAYLRYLATGRRGWYWLTGGLLMGALLSNVATLILPLLLILIDWFRGERHGRRAAEKIPFLFLAALVGFIAWHAPSDPLRPNLTDRLPLARQLVFAGFSLAFYGAKLAAPLDLACRYHYDFSALPASSLAAAVAAPLAIGIALWRGRRRKLLVFGLLFFLIGILPALRVVPAGPPRPADRYLYYPALGLFLLAGVGVSRLVRGRGPRAAGIALAVLALGLAPFSWRRAGVWHDSVALYSDELRSFPADPVPWNDRGLAFVARGDTASALADFTTALDRAPDFTAAWYNRATVSGQGGDLTAARRDYQRCLELDPDYFPARLNLGNTWRGLGDDTAAIAEYTRGLARFPDSLELRFNRALAWMACGRMDAAASDLATVVRLEPRHAAARNLLATLSR